MKIAITGSSGLLGCHTASRLHAYNCAAKFSGNPKPFDFICIDRKAFESHETLTSLLDKVDIIIHFAGVNRGEESYVEAANPLIAKALVGACRSANIKPLIVYANSIHSSHNTHYGRSKKHAGEILSNFAPLYVDLILPHVFGEYARPNYNNVTATLIDNIQKEKPANINKNGSVNLLHAGQVAEIAINAAMAGKSQTIEPSSKTMTVTGLYDKLSEYHSLYTKNIFPTTETLFELNLFNCYRAAGYPQNYPQKLTLNVDSRGTLFEAAKGGCGSQTFVSSTAPGVTRGDHFHLNKIERFLVVKGNAIIRLRKVLTDEVISFQVTGETPVAIDMVPLHTHSIENVGDDDLYTLFWTHEIFKQSDPDTFSDPVLRN